MATFKRVLLFALVGASVFTALSALAAPSFISWWYQPPVAPGAYDCTPSVEWALGRLVQAQAFAALFGAISVPLVTWLVGRRRKVVISAPPPAGTPPPPAPGH